MEPRSSERHDELYRQLTDTRNQMIKAGNALGGLSSDIRSLAKEQARLRRLVSFSSIGAYVLFAMIVSAAAYMIYLKQAEHLHFEREVLTREVANLRLRLKALEKGEEDRRSANEKAMAFYQLVRERRVQQAIKNYPALAKLPLSKVESALFGDWIGRAESKLAWAAYNDGMKAIADKEWKRAALSFRHALTLRGAQAFSAPLHYYLGVASMKLGAYPDASEAFTNAIAAGAEKRVNSQVRFHLAAVYQLSGQRQRAREAYEDYLKHHPSGSHARLARLRVRELRDN
jgi:TolA-binding protein